MPVLESGEETLVGGQAVLEGVMMRAPHSYCVAVRKANREIVTEEMPVSKVSEKYPIFKYPVLRGLGTLGQAMSLGMRALRFSANNAIEEEQAAAGDEKAKSGGEMPGWLMAANIIVSLVFFFAMYKLVPLYLTRWMKRSVPQLENHILFNLVDGLLRMAIFLAFMYLISRWKDIHRTFEFHGAEHKVVFNFESGAPVNIENAQKFVTWHPRCGTSFLMVVMIISMIVYMIVPVDRLAAQIGIRIILLPVIAGVSYELIRYAARKRGSLLALMTAPGLWLQRITTQPPSDDQVEVAIRALDGAMALEQKQGGTCVIA
jgi:uncharacterized protein YqhQ